MTIAEQLKALEEVAGVIDGQGRYRKTTCVAAPCPYDDTELEMFISEESMLAIRIHQAMKCVQAWCDSRSLETIDLGVDADTEILITVHGYGMTPISIPGPSLAHALAATIKKLAETGETK